MFKSLDSTDVALRKFKVFKNWYCSSATTGSFGIVIQDGIKDNTYFTYGDDQNPDGSYKKLVWSSIKHMYYPTESFRKNDIYYNLINIEQIQYISRSLDNGIRVLNIPSKIIGEQIKANSVIIETGSDATYKKFVDDGKYNLYIYGSDTGSNPREIVGNVFYETGQIIITSQSYTSSLDVFQLSFQSTLEIKEYEISCTVLESEFNYSSNPTARSGNSTTYIPMFVSSSQKPLITTIGLYDDNNDLVMVGKLGRPYKREYDLDTTFVLRIDL